MKVGGSLRGHFSFSNFPDSRSIRFTTCHSVVFVIVVVVIVVCLLCSTFSWFEQCTAWTALRESEPDCFSLLYAGVANVLSPKNNQTTIASMNYRNVIYNNAYLPADWAINRKMIWTEIQHRKVVLVLSKMKKVNSRMYLQIHTAIGLRSRGHLNSSFLPLGFGLVIILCDVKILNE